jgi:hypothetical protein
MKGLKGQAAFGAYWFGASAIVAVCFWFISSMDKTFVIRNWAAGISGDLIIGFLTGGLMWSVMTTPETPTKQFRFTFGAWWIGFAVMIGMMSRPHTAGGFGLVAISGLFFAVLVWGMINARNERGRVLAESERRKVLASRLHEAILDRCRALETTVGFDHMNRVVAGVYNGVKFVAQHGTPSCRSYWNGVVDGRKFLREMPENEFLVPMDAAFEMLIADDFDEAMVEAAITKI